MATLTQQESDAICPELHPAAVWAWAVSKTPLVNKAATARKAADAAIRIDRENKPLTMSPSLVT
ncbi:MAG: hypothetical protein KGL11_02280 [Alphaproteobacteria bacterium]|nr:hypothetical protein [Alphaproteobacteria bacterium]